MQACKPVQSRVTFGRKRLKSKVDKNHNMSTIIRKNDKSGPANTK